MNAARPLEAACHKHIMIMGGFQAGFGSGAEAAFSGKTIKQSYRFASWSFLKLASFVEGSILKRDVPLCNFEV